MLLDPNVDDCKLVNDDRRDVKEYLVMGIHIIYADQIRQRD